MIIFLKRKGSDQKVRVSINGTCRSLLRGTLRFECATIMAGGMSGEDTRQGEEELLARTPTVAGILQYEPIKYYAIPGDI